MRAVLFISMLAVLAGQSSVADLAESIDPVVVSPNLYEVLLENEHVRVVRYQIGLGERDEWHTHPAKVSVVTSGGSLRITTSEGRSFDVTEETGDASWMQPLGRHFAENIGTTSVVVILIEVKSAAVDFARLPEKE